MKERLVVTASLTPSSPATSSTTAANTSPLSLKSCRRSLMMVASTLVFQHANSSTLAIAGVTQSRRDELINRLLEKSKANKEKYAKERLEDYYKRNYKDYFESVEGSIRNQGKNMSVNDKEILDWLQKNR